MQKTLAKINLGAIEGNARLVKGLARGKELYAVVKADAYGHGATEVARRLSSVADAFCVAIVDEGVELRVSGISKPILVFTPPMDRDDALRMSAYDLTATVQDIPSARLSRGLGVHIKINTGMNRYGCLPTQLSAILKELASSRVTGVYSHLYAPQSPQDAAAQLEQFAQCVALVKAEYPSARAHLAATAGILLGEKYHFDAVRPGLALYGYTPEGFSLDGLKRALSVYALKVSTYSPPFGNGAGYARRSFAAEKLSSYRAGYGDGFFRGSALGEGNLCMDAFISSCDQPRLCIFDDADEYARKNNTISYEALCAVTKRSCRIYEG